MSVKEKIRNAIRKLKPKKKVIVVERVRRVPVLVGRKVLVARKPRARAVVLKRHVRITLKRKAR